jgi:hypothetical protein
MAGDHAASKAGKPPGPFMEHFRFTGAMIGCKKEFECIHCNHKSHLLESRLEHVNHCKRISTEARQDLLGKLGLEAQPSANIASKDDRAQAAAPK